MMRTLAAVMYEAGKERPYGESKPLVIEEVELEGPGQGEVLVEIAGAGLCHSDLSTLNGAIARPQPRKVAGQPVTGALPLILGHEASGVVLEVGPGVSELAVGDHVVFSFVPVCGHCEYCAAGRPALCKNGSKSNLQGTLLNGGVRFRGRDGQPVLHFLGVSAFSRYTVAAQESLVKIDPAFPLEKAALFGCAIVTGVGAVLNTARVQPGQSVVIFGLGGVGLSALMGAKLVGAGPLIVVDTQPAKFELARRLGADHTINATTEDVQAAIRDLTGGGSDFAFEAVGQAAVLAQAYNATRRGGTTVAIGLPSVSQQLTIPANVAYMEKSLLGSFMGSANPRRDIPRLLSLYQAGKLPVDELLSRHLHLDEINDGFDQLISGATARQLIQFG